MTNYILKICLLGDAGVGKTSLVYRFIENRFAQDFKSTLGVNLLKKDVEIEGNKVTAQIWDLGGQEAYRRLRKLYLEGSQGALMVFDTTNKKSFENIEDWRQSLIEVRGNDIPYVLIGNKIDLVTEQVISKTEAEEYAKKLNIPLILTSAKEGTAVEDAFIELLKLVIDSLKDKLEQVGD